jgi:hypothetical protein
LAASTDDDGDGHGIRANPIDGLKVSMDRDVSPKVLWVVGAITAAVVVAIAIIGYRDGQLMEQDRRAEEEAQRRASENNDDYAATHPSTESEDSVVAPEDSQPETSDEGYSRPPKSREESQKLGRSFAAYLSDPDECADSYSQENLDDLGVDWSAFVAACQWEVMLNR